VEPAERAALLIDNQAYFAAACAAVRRARRSVLVLGWHFDPRTALSAEGALGQPRDRIGDILLEVAQQQPQLDIRVLVWDMVLPLSAMRSLYPRRARRWFGGSRVRFHLDDSHPPGACHHQKLLVVDDAIAFCGGSDFAGNRWDTSEHLERDGRRRLPGGRVHRPRHAMTVALDGRAASALGELARDRWRRATGECPPEPSPARSDPWPPQLAVDVHGCRVAIARTLPACDRAPAVREVEALYLDGIGAARRLIYLENQYFASPRIARALEVRLAEPEGPEVVLVLPVRAPGFFDRLTMDGPRHALIARLESADRHGRFRAYAPVTAAGREIVVHSKVMIIDDWLLRAGSANISNRSMGFDTECDVALDAAHDGGVRQAIERCVQRLLGHYLEARPEEVAHALSQTGSVAAAIEALQRPQANRLRTLHGHGLDPLRRLVARYHLGDPRGASDSFRPWRRA
jgi:phosphatidylserine/phosphatidylglycerophosphate/cardiolipin synthase-like enzyme